MIVLGSLPLLQRGLIGGMSNKAPKFMIRARVILIASDTVLLKNKKIVK